jgi:hypothetical protein
MLYASFISFGFSIYKGPPGKQLKFLARLISARHQRNENQRNICDQHIASKQQSSSLITMEFYNQPVNTTYHTESFLNPIRMLRSRFEMPMENGSSQQVVVV